MPTDGRARRVVSLIRQLQDGTARRDDAKIGDVDGSFPGNESHSNKIITLAEEPPHVRSDAHSPKLFLLQRFEALFNKVATTPPSALPTLQTARFLPPSSQTPSPLVML